MKINSFLDSTLCLFCEKKKVWRWAMITVLILLALSFYQKDRFKNITDIRPEVLTAPLQSSTSQNTMTLIRDGYSYEIVPLYEYSMSGLVLSAQNYKTWYNRSRVAHTVVRDVCLIWGDTVWKKWYQNKTLSIKQDYRFCLYQYRTDGITFNGNELSNSHLIPRDAEVERQINAIKNGDQVVIKWKLVNVTGTLIDKGNKYEGNTTVWQSSTTRDDTGAWACEVIYVESVKILQKWHPWYQFMFRVSLILFTVLLLQKILCIVCFLKQSKARKIEVENEDRSLSLYKRTD